MDTTAPDTVIYSGRAYRYDGLFTKPVRNASLTEHYGFPGYARLIARDNGIDRIRLDKVIIASTIAPKEA